MTVEPCYRQLGMAVRAARVARGMSQQDVADYMGWTRAAVSNIEAGKQRVMLHDLPRIAATLGLKPRDLLPITWRPRAPAARATRGAR